ATTATSHPLFNPAATSNAIANAGTVTIAEVSLRDCNNDPLESTIGTAATVNIENTPPAVAVTSPNGGEFGAVGSTQSITWTATDDAGVAIVDIAYSTDGGATFPNAVATGVSNTGTFAWTVPSTLTTQAPVRVVAHDVNGNVGNDSSDSDFTIGQYTITASAGANGAISPTDAVAVDHGANQSFT